MIKSILRKDDSSHWYLVPVSLLDEFDLLRTELENNDYPNELLKVFEEKFSKFMVSNIYKIPLYSDLNFKKIKWRDNITDLGKERGLFENLGQLDFIELVYCIRNYRYFGDEPVQNKFFLWLPVEANFLEFDNVEEAKKYAQEDIEKNIINKFFE